jgi:Ca-activated chloride channel family protein
MLWLLTIVPGLVVWAIRARVLRARAWRELAQRGRVPRAGTHLFVACVTCLIVALAQPRLGRTGPSLLPPGHDVVLAIDVSQSMAVQDAVPNRLDSAVEAARSLVDALARTRANRVAVVAFAGRGVLRCPLTENFGAVLDSLDRLKPGGVRPGGTDLGAALDVAREAFGPVEHAEGRAIVVFSDGEDHAEKWSSRIDRLRQADITVHTVAIGDAEEGHPVPTGKSAQPLLYHGEPVTSRRVDGALESIARQTDGSIVRLGLSTTDLGTLYQAKIEPAARQRRESTWAGERTEAFPFCLIAALTFLLAACWPSRRGWRWPLTWPWHWTWSLPRPRARRRRIALFLLVGLAGLIAGAGDIPVRIGTGSVAETVRRGQAAYAAGKYEAALQQFDAAIARAPGSAIPRYNAGATLFQLKRYADARKRYVEAREQADASLRTKIDYAIGNTALVEGDVVGAIRYYDDCLASTAPGVDLDAVRLDAAINRKFALEQPRTLSQPEANTSGDRSERKRPNGRRGPNRKNGDQPSEDQTGNDQGGGGGNDQGDGKGDRDRQPSGRRRLGGAGGESTNLQGGRGDSPDDRLDAALERIQAAKNRRLPEEEPPQSANDDRKDW